MSPVERAVSGVQRLKEDLDSGAAQWMDALDVLIPFIAPDTLDAMVAAMSPKLRNRFYNQSRLQFGAFEEIIGDRIAEGRDPRGWIALRDWLYRQPFQIDASLPLPTLEEARTLSTAQTFQRILPHVKTRSVEAILDQLPLRWRKGALRSLVRGMRPGLPTILATCRAHGQDEEPWLILMAWEARLPTAPAP
jgi:hypothetical protein